MDDQHDQHEQDDEPSIDEAVLQDVGRWRRDQDRIDAHGTSAEAHDAHDADDEVESLTDDEREAIIARVSSRRLTAVRKVSDDQIETTVSHQASSRTQVGLPRPRPPLRWRLVASHGVAAGIAAAIVLAAAPGPSTVGSPADELPRFERVRVLGTSASAHLGDDAESCLDGLAQVRIDPSDGGGDGGGDDRGDGAGEGASAGSDVPLEVMILAKPASGASHWVVHRLGDNGSPWTRSDDGSLFFEAPLSRLAPLWPGDWTLDFHVGPRGACGPDALPSCRDLPTVVVSVAACDGAR